MAKKQTLLTGETPEKRGKLTQRESAALQRVFETVPEGEIVNALIDSGDQKAIALAERLTDDGFSRTGLAKHCAAVGLLPKDVWTILIDTRKLSAKLAISEKLVEIVGAVADAAVAQEIACPKCKGTGSRVKKKGEEPVECDRCFGDGIFHVPPDKESQKMALEMGELLNQKVPLIAQQFNSYKAGGQQDVGVPDMADWVRGNDRVFEKGRTDPPIEDAEVVGES